MSRALIVLAVAACLPRFAGAEGRHLFLRQEYGATCWTPPSAPDGPFPIGGPTAPPMSGTRLAGWGPSPFDPQVAASDDYLLVFNATAYTFYDRATGQPLSGTGCPPMSASFTSLFLPLLLNRDPGGNPNPADVNFTVPSTPLACHPAKPGECPGSCVNEIYDARAIYHGGHFWIMVGARNQLSQNGLKACPTNPPNSPQSQRYIFLAVSKTRDPRQGFWIYGLAEHYADWPIFAVDDEHVVLTSGWNNQDPRKAFVYKTSLLASGSHQDPYLGHVDDGAFAGRDTVVLPVRRRGDANGYSMLVSYGGDRLTLYAFRDGRGNVADHWAKISLSLDGAPTLGMQPVFHDGAIYLAYEYSTSRGNQGIAVQKIVVQLPDSPSQVKAWKHPTIRFSEDDHNLVVPGLEVNSENVVLVWYARWGTGSNHTPPEVRYRALYPQQTQFGAGTLLQAGGARPASLTDYWGNLDLSGGVVDPKDPRDLWIAHTYNEPTGPWQTVARIHPGCGPLEECGGRCVDTGYDTKNCGGCGKQCSPGGICSAGVCCPLCRCGVGHGCRAEICEHVCRGRENLGDRPRPPVHD